jgi:hypothetical protein
LREEHRLKVFENRVLRIIFGPEKDEVKGEWRKLHSTELHNLYSSPDVIRQIKSRRMRSAEHVACMGEGWNVYRVLVRKSEGKSLLGWLRRKWKYGSKMDLREIGWVGGVLSEFTWLRIGTVGGLLCMRWWTSGFCGQGVTLEIVNLFLLCSLNTFPVQQQ